MAHNPNLLEEKVLKLIRRRIHLRFFQRKLNPRNPLVTQSFRSYQVALADLQLYISIHALSRRRVLALFRTLAPPLLANSRLKELYPSTLPSREIAAARLTLANLLIRLLEQAELKEDWDRANNEDEQRTLLTIEQRVFPELGRLLSYLDSLDDWARMIVSTGI
ncbi:MAG: hypothetical protein COU08_03340 [Candidatus Harrisonbacteria bacterium CG10_big_fil_rev_8_21_14_0_10_42_17]|uniref:Uncharacterized protein n=1 Tax=Candidatus Harrisonbacteria bacterium CG10_big_fil_rev_8_21_14_0_10_42_17 TaxID=1974584 RepID=A0A2M6WHP5_9BACT|nr:MAG: hypothetical protein COU08_03340 [Candidatus Harrisonbacteria bacterium CG10_big_fil_rev_8_21_14_0_10_42_17]